MAIDVKKTLTWVGIALIFIIIVVPYIALVVVLKRQGKRIELYPEIKVVEITNENPIDINVLSSALAAAQAISKKVTTKKK